MKIEDIESRELLPGTEVRFVHSGRSITACRIIDVFSPVREDYR